MANQKLMDAYEKVFDAQGEIKPCGRGACISLIEECEKVKHQVYFGDSHTGRMDIEAIKWLVTIEKES
ncbi:MAG: hypothetical protein HFJ58_06670 [Clostridia bacterium]|nr:hypothetical protein [Clostridia bacterium]